MSADISLQVDLVTMGARLLVEAKVLLLNVSPAVRLHAEGSLTDGTDKTTVQAFFRDDIVLDA